MTRSVCSVRLSCMYVLKRDIKKRMLALSVRWLVDEGKSGSPRMLAFVHQGESLAVNSITTFQIRLIFREMNYSS